MLKNCINSTLLFHIKRFKKPPQHMTSNACVQVHTISYHVIAFFATIDLTPNPLFTQHILLQSYVCTALDTTDVDVGITVSVYACILPRTVGWVLFTGSGLDRSCDKHLCVKIVCRFCYNPCFRMCAVFYNRIFALANDEQTIPKS